MPFINNALLLSPFRNQPLVSQFHSIPHQRRLSTSVLPSHSPGPHLIHPIIVQPVRARVRDLRALVAIVINQEGGNAGCRTPATNGVITIAEGTWTARCGCFPKLLLIFGVRPEVTEEAGRLEVAR